MSAASRSKVRARARHREQVARAIAANVQLYTSTSPARASGELATHAVLDGLWPDDETGACYFDVHAAREHADKLIARAAQLAMYPPHRYRGHDLARLGRRILAALEGQPSECQGGCWPSFPAGKRKIDHEVMGDPQGGASTCPACRGTGHNLRGSLPPVEWSPSVHRKIHDSHLGPGFDAHPGAWTFGLDYEGTLLMGHHQYLGSYETRSVPRGEHRERDEAEPGSWVPGVSPHGRVRVTGYMEMRWAPWSSMPSDDKEACEWARALMPRWRRGELRHAEQRRRKEAAAWKMVRGRRLALEATTLLQEWLDGYERAGIRPEMTPLWLADAENYIASHHSQPDAVTLRFDGEARSIVAGVTLAPSIDPLTIRGSFKV